MTPLNTNFKHLKYKKTSAEPRVAIGREAKHSNAMIAFTNHRFAEFDQRGRCWKRFSMPSPETAAVLLWALLASGQNVMRKVDGWKTLAEKPSEQIIELAA